VAAVIVTAKLPPFGRVGQKLDVTVSSVGDAKSLAGGTLLVTPLKAGDGQVYAIANGALSLGNMDKSKMPTTAKIPNGGIVERELELEFNNKKSIRMALNQPDFTTVARVEKSLNQFLGGKFASAADSATIDLIIPSHYERKVVELVALIENIQVIKDHSAKIVINERTGTIVAGGDITLSKVAISHGDLIIEVGAGGAKGGKPGSLHLIEKKTTLKQLVEALNAMGTTPQDLISIFQTLKQNGALIADIEFI
jgi:flagellar P-ring protein precursor FlgI